MTLNELNHLPESAAREWFAQCCAASNWCQRMQQLRPYAHQQQLKTSAEQVWKTLSTDDFLEAFEAHPMIGNLQTLRKKFAHTASTAQQEQAGTAVASQAVLEKLQVLNQRYLQKNGFIFIICATGLSAVDMLTALEARIDNPREQEINIAAAQQLAITLLRLDKYLTT